LTAARAPLGLRVLLNDPQTGHRSPLPLRYTMRTPGSPPVARLVWTTSSCTAGRNRRSRQRCFCGKPALSPCRPDCRTSPLPVPVGFLFGLEAARGDDVACKLGKSVGGSLLRAARRIGRRVLAWRSRACRGARTFPEHRAVLGRPMENPRFARFFGDVQGNLAPRGPDRDVAGRAAPLSQKRGSRFESLRRLDLCVGGRA
jgi:hypothetical protein